MVPDLTVDGLAFEMQAVGGISQIFRESLPRLCDAGALVTVCTASDAQQPVPSHPRLTHLHFGSYGRLARPEGKRIPVAAPLRRILLSSRLGDRRASTWQSTYYTLPPRGWKGAHVVFVADLIYEMFGDTLSSRGDSFFRAQKRRCIQAADTVICISETTKSDLLELFDLPESVIQVVYLAASDVYRQEWRARQQHRSHKDERFFLYVGGRDKYKNFRIVLDALALWKPPQEVRLVVAGPPFTTTEVEDLEARGLAQSVEHVGRPSDRELAKLYIAASGLIYPSLYEGFGIPLVEAMTCQCPVIASDIPSSREITAGLAAYFHPDDATSLAAQLERLLQEPSPHLDAALQRSQEFSWDRTAGDMLNIYLSL